ncbi:phosphotransferase family protein [Sphingopyxis sp. PET50]|uniref:phosphotransferase family protein n=1 Tax=Sphingopyxis sp. PET50 TaxID=2976533 RepID=UPI0021AE5616|nr:phosphotransferase family protein [Sphingopyxis sp. PET50]
MTGPNEGAADRLGPALQDYLAESGSMRDLRIMPDGHAGTTFGFELARADGASERYIFKKAPDGVPRRGSTDIFRQARLLRALHAAGLPVPDVPWAGSDDIPFGAPFIIMTRLPGRSLIVWDPAPGLLAEFTDPMTIWTATARLMGELHRFDWQASLGGWEAATGLPAELDRWTHLLRHMADGAQRAIALALAERLRLALPAAGPVGLVHGDLQPGNLLFDRGDATGLIDWDLAAIAPLGLDVGWLLMIADPRCWAPDWSPIAPPPRTTLLDTYREAGGAALADIDWHQAFAAFRMAAITGLNLKLHRDGRRPDPVWEKFGASVPFLLGA